MSNLTFNPDDIPYTAGYVPDLDNGNRTVRPSAASRAAVKHGVAIADFWVPTQNAGKWYCEFEVGATDEDGPVINLYAGITLPQWWQEGDASGDDLVGDYCSVALNARGQGAYTSSNLDINDSNYDTGLATFASGDIIMMAVDDTDLAAGTGPRKIWWGRNGTWFNNGSGDGDPEAGDFPLIAESSGTYVITGNADSLYMQQAWTVIVSALYGTITSRFRSTEVQYTVPTGFSCFDEFEAPSAGNTFDQTELDPVTNKFIDRFAKNGRQWHIPRAANVNTSAALMPATIARGPTGKYYFEAELWAGDATNYVNWGVVLKYVQTFTDGVTWASVDAADTWSFRQYQQGDSGIGTDDSMQFHEGLGDTADHEWLGVVGRDGSNRCRMMIAIDFDNDRIYVGTNGDWYTTAAKTGGNPEDGTGIQNSSALTNAIYPHIWAQAIGAVAEFFFNEQDLEYTVPTGYEPWGGSSTTDDTWTSSASISAPFVGNKKIVGTVTVTASIASPLVGSSAIIDDLTFTASAADAYTRLMEAAASMTHTVELTEAFAGGGIYIADLEFALLALHSSDIGADEIHAWCITLGDQVSSQEVVPAYRFDNFGFNDFVEIDGELHGLADDGIFELEGDDDDGAEILATAVVPRESFGDEAEKRIEHLLVRAASEKGITAKLTVQNEQGDFEEYEYETEEAPGSKPATKRIKIGRGLVSGEWDIVLENQDGEYSEIFELVAVMRKLKRRGKR